MIDGHDVKALRRAIGEALEADRPVVVHCKTVKGKGFEPAEEGGLEGMEKWHAAKPGSISNGIVAEATAPKRKPKFAKPPQYTTVFGEALVEECRRDDRVVGITAAMNSGTGLNILQRELPERYYDVGIAEQHAILFAAGLALQGAKPVAAIYSTFLQRAYDQIVHDVCLQNLNVVFAMDRAGLVGDDGPTHHGAFDISYMRCLPNLVQMAPRDEATLVHMLRTAVLYDDGPIALRYPRGEGEGVPLPGLPEPVEIGRGELLREGERVALLGYGYGVSVALGAAALLSDEHGVEPTVADARFAKPLDADLVERLAAEHDLLVTVEENVLAGGFGSGVLEHLADRDLLGGTRVLRIGLPDRFVTHGKPALLREEVGLTPEAVADRVAQAVLEPTGALASITAYTDGYPAGRRRSRVGERSRMATGKPASRSKSSKGSTSNGSGGSSRSKSAASSRSRSGATRSSNGSSGSKSGAAKRSPQSRGKASTRSRSSASRSRPSEPQRRAAEQRQSSRSSGQSSNGVVDTVKTAASKAAGPAVAVGAATAGCRRWGAAEESPRPQEGARRPGSAVPEQAQPRRRRRQVDG